MSKYKQLEDKKSKKLGLFLKLKPQESNKSFVITKMQPPQSTGKSKAVEFSNMTKTICHRKDLAIFLNQMKCNVIFVGDSHAGKTSVINQFVSSTFDSDYLLNYMVDCKTKSFDILGVKYNVNFWDIPIQTEMNFLHKSYLLNINVIVVVVDLSRPFENVVSNALKWMNKIVDDRSGSHINPIIILLGTKKDLVPAADLKRLEKQIDLVSREYEAEYFSISSRCSKDVNDLFKRFVCLAFEKSVLNLIKPQDYDKIKNNISSKCLKI
jgi:small GTP-binding protein